MGSSIAPVMDRPKTEKWIACPEHFQVGTGTPFSVEVLERDPTYSLYCLDFESGDALFTKVAEPDNVADAAFVFEAQREKATHVVRAPLAVLHELATSCPVDPSKIALIHSVGRCGSTLVSRALASQSFVGSLSEPDVFTQLVATWGYKSPEDVERQRILRDCALVQCLPGALRGQTHHALKFRSYVTCMAKLFSRAVPEAKTVFMYRELLSWMGSYVRMLGGGDLRAEYPDANYIKLLGTISPLLNGRNEATRLEVVVYNWLASMEAALDLIEDGVSPFLIRFEELRGSPKEAPIALFRWLEIEAPDDGVLDSLLAKDSQEGTGLSRERLANLEVTIDGGIVRWVEEIVRKSSSRLRMDTIITGTWDVD